MPDDPKRPKCICRDGDKDQIEVQADMYAASLLMPAGMMRRKWCELTVHGEPVSLDELRAKESLAFRINVERRLKYKDGLNLIACVR